MITHCSKTKVIVTDTSKQRGYVEPEGQATQQQNFEILRLEGVFRAWIYIFFFHSRHDPLFLFAYNTKRTIDLPCSGYCIYFFLKNLHSFARENGKISHELTGR